MEDNGNRIQSAFFSQQIFKLKNRLCYIKSFQEQMKKTLASRKRINHDKIYMLWEKYVLKTQCFCVMPDPNKQ